MHKYREETFYYYINHNTKKKQTTKEKQHTYQLEMPEHFCLSHSNKLINRLQNPHFILTFLQILLFEGFFPEAVHARETVKALVFKEAKCIQNTLKALEEVNYAYTMQEVMTKVQIHSKLNK